MWALRFRVVRVTCPDPNGLHVGETRTRSGTNLFGVFSCVGSFWTRADVVCYNTTCEVWEDWLSAVWAIGFSDWLCASCMTILIGGVASESARCVGGAESCVGFVFQCTLFRHFSFIIASRACAERTHYCFHYPCIGGPNHQGPVDQFYIWQQCSCHPPCCSSCLW